MSERSTLVLIVDDEPLMRWALAETLAGPACRIVEAGDARAAVEVLADGSRRFDVVVLGSNVPDARDLTLLATTRRLSPESRVIMMTGFMPPEVVTRALELGACRVLQKPVDLDALAALVFEACGANRSPPARGGD